MNWQMVLDALPSILLGGGGLVIVVLSAVAITVMSRRRRDRRDLTILRNDVAELAGQLEDFARRVNRQVDDRVNRLQVLLAEAQKKEEELKRLIDAAPQTTTDAVGASSDAAGQVFVLASQGLDSVEIARRLQMEVGEVELMLNLHRSRMASGA